MRKLTGISSVKNNKSCSIIQNGSNKIGFAFFRFFYDFLRNLQESANSLYYFSCAFAGRPSERKVSLQCSPWGRWPARAGQIPAMCSRSPAEEGGGVTRGSSATGLWAGWVENGGRRWSAALPGGGAACWPRRPSSGAGGEQGGSDSARQALGSRPFYRRRPQHQEPHNEGGGRVRP
jgi:hypothetical protein